jgi:hypothetical protein
MQHPSRDGVPPGARYVPSTTGSAAHGRRPPDLIEVVAERQMLAPSRAHGYELRLVGATVSPANVATVGAFTTCEGVGSWKRVRARLSRRAKAQRQFMVILVSQSRGVRAATMQVSHIGLRRRVRPVAIPQMRSSLARVGTVLGCVVSLALSACGGDGGPAGVTIGTRSPARSAHGSNVTVSLDYTTARSAREIGRSYVDRARVLADPVLTSGGHLRVVVSAGAGVAPAVLLDEDVPPARDLRGNARKRFLMNARAVMHELLAQALGLVHVKGGSLRDALAAMRADGSDVAGAVFHETGLLSERGGGILYVLSDGLQRDEDVDFSRTIERMPEARAIRALRRSMPSHAARVDIGIRGIGLTGNAKRVSTGRSRKLQRVWGAACKASAAKSCMVSTSV